MTAEEAMRAAAHAQSQEMPPDAAPVAAERRWIQLAVQTSAGPYPDVRDTLAWIVTMARPGDTSFFEAAIEDRTGELVRVEVFE